MFSRISLFIFFGFLSSLSVAQDNSEDPSEFDLSNPSDAISYAVGMSIGSNLIEQEILLNDDIPIDLDTFIIGIRDGIANQLKMTQEQMNSALSKYQTMNSQQQEREQLQREAREIEARAQYAAWDQYECRGSAPVMTAPQGYQVEQGSSSIATVAVHKHENRVMITGWSQFTIPMVDRAQEISEELISLGGRVQINKRGERVSATYGFGDNRWSIEFSSASLMYVATFRNANISTTFTSTSCVKKDWIQRFRW